jgi:hypothetical protein
MQLEVVRGTDTIIGSLTQDGTPPRTFTGWIGLTAAIDAALSTADAPATTWAAAPALTEAPPAPADDAPL